VHGGPKSGGSAERRDRRRIREGIDPQNCILMGQIENKTHQKGAQRFRIEKWSF